MHVPPTSFINEVEGKKKKKRNEAYFTTFPPKYRRKGKKNEEERVFRRLIKNMGGEGKYQISSNIITKKISV
jgi:hypothetical protein